MLKKILFIIFALPNGPTQTTRFTVVTTSHELRQLIGDEDMPSGPEDSQIRRRICEDISHSVFARLLGMVPIDVADVSHSHPNYWMCETVFEETYTPTNSGELLYTNPYRLRTFTAISPFQYFREQVFVCTLMNQLRDKIHLFYVSKEYNISSSTEQHFTPGRFVFGSLLSGTSWPYSDILLAEQPVKARTEPDFNVEMHYLQIRKFVLMSKGPHVDPLCKLLSGDFKDHLYRICAAIAASSYFANELQYPRRPPSDYQCHTMEISFRTDEGREASGEQLYQERLAKCKYYPIRRSDTSPKISLYVSRAYRSKQIFIYRSNPFTRKMYLENLSIDASVVDEINSFDFVED